MYIATSEKDEDEEDEEKCKEGEVHEVVQGRV